MTILAESPEYDQQTPTNRGPSGSLVSWIMRRLSRWEDHRRTNYEGRWDEYYRLWRGIWDAQDKSRKSERSRLISPALQQAVESTVAELEEATFGRDRWIDIADDLLDEDKESLSGLVAQLIEDMDLARVPDAIAESYLNGALYGTLIAKIVLDESKEMVAEPQDVPGTAIIMPRVQTTTRLSVRLLPVDPREFVIDPAAKDIESALGVAHVTTVPKHSVTEKQRKGIYKDVEVGNWTPDGKSVRFGEISSGARTGETGLAVHDDIVQITEYHGLVPWSMMSALSEDEVTVVDEEQDHDDDDLVEVIVTIANQSLLLRAVENPYLFKDRSFVACPFDLVPNRFWGRGIAEKGYNPQKALDAEQRARVDALAFSVHPMMGINASALPRDGRFEVYPGRTIATPGNPSEHLHMIKFPPPDTQTYKQTGELERQIQMGTGAMDSAAPVGVSPRNATASGMSMILAGALKRSKRSLSKIERLFLRPAITKIAHRYMQFDDQRYPIKDYKFRVHSTLGIMAREFEQQQLTQLLATVPPESPAYWLILKAIIDYSSIGIKDQLMPLIDGIIQQSMQPQEPQPDPRTELDATRLQVEAARDQTNAQIKAAELALKAQQAGDKTVVEALKMTRGREK